MDPIIVRPRDGFDAIGVGTTKGYELIASGDLKTIKIGRATRITVESIQAFVAKLVNDQCIGVD